MATIDSAQLSAQPQLEKPDVFTVRKRGKDARKITKLQVAKHFTKTLKEAAKALGISGSKLEQGIRTMGIARWPGRTVRSLNIYLEMFGEQELDIFGEGDLGAT